MVKTVFKNFVKSYAIGIIIHDLKATNSGELVALPLLNFLIKYLYSFF